MATDGHLLRSISPVQHSSVIVFWNGNASSMLTFKGLRAEIPFLNAFRRNTRELPCFMADI